MKTVKLGDVADVYVSGVDKKTLPNEQPVCLCNYTDVYHNWTIRKEMSEGFMLASARPNEIAKFRLRAGQVAMTKDSETRSDIGHSAFVADDFEDVILGYHCALISPHEGKLNGQYLNGLLRTRHISDYLSRNAGGSGQRFYLSDSTIKAMPISLPPYATQLRIAGILVETSENARYATIGCVIGVIGAWVSFGAGVWLLGSRLDGRLPGNSCTGAGGASSQGCAV